MAGSPATARSLMAQAMAVSAVPSSPAAASSWWSQSPACIRPGSSPSGGAQTSGGRLPDEGAGSSSGGAGASSGHGSGQRRRGNRAGQTSQPSEGPPGISASGGQGPASRSPPWQVPPGGAQAGGSNRGKQRQVVTVPVTGSAGATSMPEFWRAQAQQLAANGSPQVSRAALAASLGFGRAPCLHQ